jgi:hypothetical protein
VLLIASWDKYRIPVKVALTDPEIKGHQNILFRKFLSEFEVTCWVKQVVVEADSGFAANETFTPFA